MWLAILLVPIEYMPHWFHQLGYWMGGLLTIILFPAIFVIFYFSWTILKRNFEHKYNEQ